LDCKRIAGFIVSRDGTNKAAIVEAVEKAWEVVDKVIYELMEVCLGIVRMSFKQKKVISNIKQLGIDFIIYSITIAPSASSIAMLEALKGTLSILQY